MGIFDSAARALGSLRPMSDAELERDREALRQRYVSSKDVTKATTIYRELLRYDEESTRRSNDKYESEQTNRPERRHREHGWYLPNDE